MTKRYTIARVAGMTDEELAQELDNWAENREARGLDAHLLRSAAFRLSGSLDVVCTECGNHAKCPPDCGHTHIDVDTTGAA